MRVFLIFLPLLLQLPLNAQPGCTDPQATNFDPGATENDGSCEYVPTAYTPELVAELPVDMEECSGLAFFENQLFTHLDGGNLDRLFTLDTLTAEKLQTITIPNADNTDWEDLAEDDEHIYIGDFGNNSGARTDLRIYKIKKSDLLSGTISPELIEFTFSDQTNFTPMSNANDYDCEGFFFWQDSLHLFSKNWVNFKTRHYVLPTSPGSQVAELRDSFNVQGQITAADITEDGKALLLGYNVSTSETFLWLLFDFEGSDFFSGNKRRISMGSAIGISQPEGIVFRDMTRGYICSERFSVLPQKLFSFDVKQWVENPVNADNVVDSSSAALSVFPNPVGDFLNIQCPQLSIRRVNIFDSKSQLAFSQKIDKHLSISELRVNISHLNPGNYFLWVSDGTETKATAFQKK